MPDITVHRKIRGDLRVVGRRFTSSCDAPLSCFVCSSGRLNRLGTFIASDGVRMVVVGSRGFGTAGGSTHHVCVGLSSFNKGYPVSIVTRVGPVLVVSRPRSMRKTGAGRKLGQFGPLFALHCSTARHRLCGLICHLSTVRTCGLRLIGGVTIGNVSVDKAATARKFICLRNLGLCPSGGPATGVKFRMGEAGTIGRMMQTLGVGSSLCTGSGRLRRCQGSCMVASVGNIRSSIAFQGNVGLCTNSMTNDIGRARLQHVRVQRAVLSRVRGRRRLFRGSVGILSLFFVSRMTGCHQCGPSKGKRCTRVFRRRCASVVGRLSPSLFGRPRCVSCLGSAITSGTRRKCFSGSGGKGLVSDGARQKAGRSTSRSTCSLVVGGGRHLLSQGRPVHFVFSRSTLQRK